MATIARQENLRRSERVHGGTGECEAQRRRHARPCGASKKTRGLRDYTDVMDQSEALSKARQFADRAYTTAAGKISRQFSEKIGDSRARLAQKGILHSSGAVIETTKLHGERLTALLQSRLDALLEGLQLYHVQLDDQLIDDLVKEITNLRETCIKNTLETLRNDTVFTSGVMPRMQYAFMLQEYVEIGANEVRTQIERWRLMPQMGEPTTSINVYHVQGSNNRWLTNAEDHSVNVITQSSREIFVILRQEIESNLPVGDEQKDILERLSALEQAQNSPSFKQRYTEFIATAANHMQLLAPFIPALTEMLQKSM
jgi:hypothetical protein